MVSDHHPASPPAPSARGPAALDGLGDTLDFGDCHIEPSHRFIATVADVTEDGWRTYEELPTWLAAAPRASEVCKGCRP